MKYNREDIFKYTGPESIPEGWTDDDYSFDGSNLICDEMCANLNNLVGYDLDDSDKPINVLVIACLDEYIKKEILAPEFQEKAKEAEGIKPHAPTISPTAGTYKDSVEVTITSSQDDVTIMYNITGNSKDWEEYTEPITLTESTTVSAYCTKNGVDSDLVDVLYTIE